MHIMRCQKLPNITRRSLCFFVRFAQLQPAHSSVMFRHLQVKHHHGNFNSSLSWSTFLWHPHSGQLLESTCIECIQQITISMTMPIAVAIVAIIKNYSICLRFPVSSCFLLLASCVFLLASCFLLLLLLLPLLLLLLRRILLYYS